MVRTNLNDRVTGELIGEPTGESATNPVVSRVARGLAERMLPARDGRPLIGHTQRATAAVELLS
jgi:hypothetical protein